MRVAQLDKNAPHFPAIHRSFYGLRSRLLLIALIGVVPSLLLIVTIHLDHRRSTTAAIRNSVARLTELIGRQIQETLKSSEHILFAISQSQQILHGDPESVSARLSQMHQRLPIFANLGVVDLQGRVSGSTGWLKDSDNVSQSSWFRQAVSEQRFSVGQDRPRSHSALPVMVAAYPVIEGNELRKVIFATIDSKWISELIVKMPLAADAAAVIADDRGNVLFRYPDSSQWVGKAFADSPLFTSLLSGQSAEPQAMVGLDGISRIYAAVHLGASQGAISFLLGFSEKEAIAKANNALMVHLSIMLAIALIGLFSALLYANQGIVAPVGALVTAAQKLANEFCSSRSGVDAYDDSELRYLCRTFDTMAAAIEKSASEQKAARDALRRSEELIATAFRSSPDAMTLTDLADGRIVEINETGLKLTGFARDEVIGRTILELGFWADAAVRQRYAERLLKDGRVIDFEADFRIKSGEIRAGLISGEVIVIQARKHILSVIRDITEQKRAEEELKIANQELLDINRLIATTTSAAAGVQRILDSVLDQTLSITGLEGGAICLIGADQALHQAAGRPASGRPATRLSPAPVPMADSFCGECARHHRPIILADRQAVTEFTPGQETLCADVRFLAAFPLSTADKCLGVLCIFTQTQHTPSARRLKLIETVSSQIALAVQNAQLYEQTLHNAEELERTVRQRTTALQENQSALTALVKDLELKSSALEAANTRLRELDRLKAIFIASMSHELRTPLNSIIGFTGIILQGLSGEINSEQRDQLNRVYRSSKHLLALINDVIDISKIEAGKIDLRVETFDLDKVLHEAESSLMPQATGKGLVFQVASCPGLLLRTDRSRLLQCILNLLSNAVKFTEKGEVSVSVNDMGEMVEIRVKDTGIGIKQEDLPRLFNSFTRINSHLRTAVLGTGLGLYLTKKIAEESLRGSVTAESVHQKGSCFSIRIPKDAERLAEKRHIDFESLERGT